VYNKQVFLALPRRKKYLMGRKSGRGMRDKKKGLGGQGSPSHRLRLGKKRQETGVMGETFGREDLIRKRRGIREKTGKRKGCSNVGKK